MNEDTPFLPLLPHARGGLRSGRHHSLSPLFPRLFAASVLWGMNARKWSQSNCMCVDTHKTEESTKRRRYRPGVLISGGSVQAPPVPRSRVPLLHPRLHRPAGVRTAAWCTPLDSTGVSRRPCSHASSTCFLPPSPHHPHTPLLQLLQELNVLSLTHPHRVV